MFYAATEFFRRWTVSLELSPHSRLLLLLLVSGTLCLSHYVTKISHLYSLRDFWRYFGLCRAAAHSDCCFFAPCTNILTYLLTYAWNLGFADPSLRYAHRHRGARWRTAVTQYILSASLTSVNLCISSQRISCWCCELFTQHIDQCTAGVMPSDHH